MDPRLLPIPGNSGIPSGFQEKPLGMDPTGGGGEFQRENFWEWERWAVVSVGKRGFLLSREKVGAEFFGNSRAREFPESWESTKSRVFFCLFCFFPSHFPEKPSFNPGNSGSSWDGMGAPRTPGVFPHPRFLLGTDFPEVFPHSRLWGWDLGSPQVSEFKIPLDPRKKKQGMIPKKPGWGRNP